MSAKDRIKRLMQHFKYDDKFFKGEEDRKELMALSDIQRNDILMKRGDEIQKLSERFAMVAE